MAEARRIKRERLPGMIRESFRFQRFGPFDPTCQWHQEVFWKAWHGPEGPVTLALRWESDCIEAHVWGELQEAALGPLLGELDEPGALVLAPDDPLRSLPGKIRGMRLLRVPWVADYAARVVLQQRVTWQEAARAYVSLTKALGKPAPGPRSDLLLPPSPRDWYRFTPADYAQVGVEGKRARPLRELARKAPAVDLADDPIAIMNKLPGFGVWTLAQIKSCALGDPDAVPLGDYGLPHLVTFALTGEPRGDDDRMLKLLEPYRGQRYRVIRWLEASGVEAPRFGPRAKTSTALG